MSDQIKSCLGMLLFTSTFILPLVGLAIGWIGWDLETGAIIGLVTFTILFLLAGTLLISIKDPSWVTASVPFVFGLCYSLLPDFIPGTIDDGIAFTGGSILSFVLWHKKKPDIPKWIVLPLLAGGTYTFIGGLIPGPFDELIVYGFLTALSAILGSIRRQNGDINTLLLENGESLRENYIV